MQETKREDSGVREIDIFRLLRMLWKRAWVIVAAALIFALFAWMYSRFMIEPTYRTSFSAYINNKALSEENSSTTTSDLSASKGLMYVYQEIVVSRTVLIQAAMQCGLYEQGYSLVSNMVRAYVSADAPILTVYVETEDPELSQGLAEAIAQIAPAQVAAVVAGSTMTLIDPPYTPSSPYTPNITSNSIYGALLGLVLSVIVLIIIDLVYDNVLEGDDLEGRYQIPVVGRIPDLQLAQKNDVRYGVGKERGLRR